MRSIVGSDYELGTYRDSSYWSFDPLNCLHIYDESQLWNHANGATRRGMPQVARSSPAIAVPPRSPQSISLGNATIPCQCKT